MQKGSKKKPIRKPQHQNRPGQEFKMTPLPDAHPDPGWKKLEGKKVLITGGDSGIGRAVAVLFAKHGADIAISFLNEKKDAEDTATMVNKFDSDCILIPGDVSKENHCKSVVQKTIKKFGRLDILINNAAIHYESKTLEDISTAQLLKTFSTNIFSYFWVTRYALQHMEPGSAIVNSTSVTAYRGSPSLIDYASTKGAIVSFTRSLSSNLVDKGIRVNAVAPGPIWTPLIASSFKPSKVAAHGSDAPMKRAGEPAEVAPCYLFLASDDASYITGQVLHPNGGEIVNG